MQYIKKIFTTKEDGNLAFHVNDDEKRVLNNHINLAKKYNFNIDNLRHMNQIHTSNIKIVNHNSAFLNDSCDALITNEKNLPLMVMVADCIPILIYDEKKSVIAAVHAGRNSTFLEIVKHTILKMQSEFSCETSDIKVILGPSIQKCCYEVNLELRDLVSNKFSKDFVNNKNIDLQGINKYILQKMGIKDIEVSNLCTKCTSKNHFSYRADKNCGRFAGIIEIIRK